MYLYSLFSPVWLIAFDACTTQESRDGMKICPVMLSFCLLIENLIFIVEMVFKTADKGPSCHPADQLFTGRVSYLDICDILLNQNMQEQKTWPAELVNCGWIKLHASFFSLYV